MRGSIASINVPIDMEAIKKFSKDVKKQKQQVH